MSEPDKPDVPSAGLDDVLITAELSSRPSRPPDYEAETKALAALAQEMAASPQTVLQKLVDTALELCRADSAGVSILEPGAEGDLFRWHAIAGRFARNLNGAVPRAASPCGEVVRQDAALLFAHPDRHFPVAVSIDSPVVEALLVPFHVDGRPAGTVWLIAHTPERKFDAEDARLLTHLSRFAAAGYQMTTALQKSLAAGDDLQRQVRERTEALRRSDERYRRIVETAHEGVWVVDADARTRYANRRMAEMLGCPAEELAARSLFDFVFEEDRPAVERSREERLRGRSDAFDFRYRRKDGSAFWAHVSTNPLFEGGAFVGALGMFTDITDRKRREANLAFLADVSQDLARLTNVEATTDALCAKLCAYFHASRCAFAEVDEGRQVVAVTHEWKPADAPAFKGRYRFADYATAEYREACRAGKTYVARDGALVGAPVVRDGVWSFALNLYDSPPRDWRDDEVELLRELTTRIGARLERARAEAALRESEDRLRLALAAARMGIWTLDLDTGAHTRGPNLNRLLGLEPVETTQPFDEFLTHVHPDDRAALEEAFAASTREGKPLNVEFRVVRPDGSVRWLRDQGDVFGDAAAGVRRMAGACVDVTERAEAEGKRRASEERLRQVLASATDFAIFTLDAARRVTGWSPGAEAVFGWPEAEMLGRLADEIFTPEDRADGAPEREAEEARREGRAADERWHVRKGGDRFYASGVMTPLDGGFVKVLRDLTERKRMEDELRDADRRKDEFLAMLGHELRNPLAPLRGAMETLRRQKLDGDGLARAHAMIDRQVGHLTRLVDDLLDVSRITRGLIELRKEPVDLAEAADQAVEMVTPVTEGRGHDLQLSLPRKPLRVEGDVTRLTQVIFNLLNNAAKYTNAGGRIRLTAEREGDEAVVRVRDNGTGMAADLVPKVFDLFTQGDRTPDRSQGGFGLGLTLVKRLVEMHGGTVEARSEGPGRGSEFTVRLPALPAEEAKPAPPRPYGPPQAAARADRALVIDDNFDVAESMTWMLEGLAREIKMAHGGKAALEMVAEYRPDLILCDIGMPGMDGYETCRRLRRTPGLEKTLIAAVSGYGNVDDRRKSKEAGFDRHLVKPVGRATLEELVRSAAEGG